MTRRVLLHPMTDRIKSQIMLVLQTLHFIFLSLRLMGEERLCQACSYMERLVILFIHVYKYQSLSLHKCPQTPSFSPFTPLSSPTQTTAVHLPSQNLWIEIWPSCFRKIIPDCPPLIIPPSFTSLFLSFPSSITFWLYFSLTLPFLVQTFKLPVTFHTL